MLQAPDEKTKWQVICEQAVFEHPHITVSMEAIRLPDGQIIPEWPRFYSGDFVNAVVLNKEKEVMILEGYQHGLEASSWQVLGSHLEKDGEPYETIQQELLQMSGYQSDNWIYLGSFVVDADHHGGVGHFFCALDAVQTAQPENGPNLAQIRWVSLKDLHYALLDGRIAGASYAINAALTLLTLPRLSH